MPEPRDLQAELDEQFREVLHNDWVAYNAYNYGRVMGFTEMQILQYMVIELSKRNNNVIRILQDIVTRTPTPIIIPVQAQTHYPPKE
jgi:hypothetical protein